MITQRKIRLPKIITDHNAEILSKYQVDGLLPKNLIYKEFGNNYSKWVINKTAKHLNYKIVCDKVFNAYCLHYKKNLPISRICQILNTDYNHVKWLIQTAEKHLQTLYETAKYRNR